MPDRFTGNSAHKPAHRHPHSPETPEPYIAADELKQAVNVAIYLRRPLLLEGEAGCGKTRLARAVAYELGLPFYRWDVRSDTKAKDGLYKYDAIRRLHDVELSKLGKSLRNDPVDAAQYRTFGALGNAFRCEECRAVVLIDEIDKADLDFPNDLLAVLEKPWEFHIPETEETITAKHEPIVIITSNKEKGNLPAPFLRRCVYHFVEFPNDAHLKQIIEEHQKYDAAQSPLPDLIHHAVARFHELREHGGLHKNPGTSEFLDWLKILQNFGDAPYPSAQLADSKATLPYPGLLLKLRDDWQTLSRSH